MHQSGKIYFVLIALTVLFSLSACKSESLDDNAKDVLRDIITVQTAGLKYYKEVSGIPSSIEHLTSSGYLNLDDLLRPWGDYLIHQQNSGYYVGLQLKDTALVTVLQRYAPRITYLSDYSLVITPLFNQDIGELPINITNEQSAKKAEHHRLGIHSNFDLLN